MPWIKIKLPLLNRLLRERGWGWERRVLEGRARLCVRAPRGVLWEFKLNRGAYLRRVTE